MFAWRNLSNANLLAAFEWLAARRETKGNGQAKAPAPDTSAPATSSSSR
jgi:hypothetical protein